MRESLLASLVKVWNSFSDRVLNLFPRLMAAMLVLAVGWILAALFRTLLSRGLRLAHFDERCERSGLSHLMRRADLPWTPSEAMGKISFWAVFVSAAIFSMSALELPILDRAVSGFFLYLPKACVALAVLVIGFLLANFLSRAALLLAVNEELPGPRVLSGTVRLLINMLAFAMAMEQLGIAQNTVTAAFIIAFGALMLGLALAFGLGGRDLARDLLAQRVKREDPANQDDLRHL